MNTASHASPTVRGHRLLTAVAMLAGALALALINLPGGALAAPGDANLSLTKSDSPDPVAEGATLTYTVAVQNLGPLAATDVVVTDPLSASNVDFVSASTTNGTCEQQANVVTCTLGTVNAGSTTFVTILVRPKKTGTLSNAASVASPDDNTPANNQDTETTLVRSGAGGQGNQVSCANPTIRGTAGNDVILGTPKADVISSLGGDDRVFAGDGKDVVCAGSGSDFVSGGAKSDTLVGATGADRLIGNGGNDGLRGNRGRDRLRGRSGDDLLNGGRNRDSCRGGSGLDTLRRCP